MNVRNVTIDEFRSLLNGMKSGEVIMIDFDDSYSKEEITKMTQKQMVARLHDLDDSDSMMICFD